MMRRSRACRLVVLVAAAIPVTLGGQPRTRTTQEKIADARSAAPPSISGQAAVMDWPAKEGDQPTQIRPGSNRWVCFPTTPQTFQKASGHDPVCLDEEWMAWGEAWSKKQPPQVKKVGIAYMLQGDAGGSNTDPFATERTADNQWIKTGPHIMVVVPDTAALAGYSSDPTNGGPWVMYKGTPYAHLMVPLAPRQTNRPSPRKSGN